MKIIERYWAVLFMRRKVESRSAYFVRLALLDFFVTFIMSIMVHRSLSFPSKEEIDNPLALWLLGVGLVPIVETILLVAVIELIRRFFVSKKLLAAGLSALFWSFLHFLQRPSWGVVVLFSFFIYSSIYCTWKDGEKTAAFAIIVCLHALSNAIPVAVWTALYYFGSIT
jgi:hypothetical protein